MTKTPSYNDLPQHIAALKKQNLLIEVDRQIDKDSEMHALVRWQFIGCLLYTSPSPRDGLLSRMPSSA